MTTNIAFPPNCVFALVPLLLMPGCQEAPLTPGRDAAAICPCQQPPPPRKPREIRNIPIRWILGVQNEDGSWGDGPATLDGHAIDDVGITSLALLPMFAIEYDGTCQDWFGDILIGTSIRKGVRWLLDQQRPDGTFNSQGSPILTQALAVLALHADALRPGSQADLKTVKAAADALAKLQSTDGSWGDDPQTLWVMHALVSCEGGEAKADPAVLERVRTYFKARAEAAPTMSEVTTPTALGNSFSNRWEDRSDYSKGPWVKSTLEDWSPAQMTYCYMAAIALMRYEGLNSHLLWEWCQPCKKVLLSSQQEDGHWIGGTRSDTIVTTSIANLTMAAIFCRVAVPLR